MHKRVGSTEGGGTKSREYSLVTNVHSNDDGHLLC